MTLLAVILGFVTGWAVSMPIGPVNAAAIMRTIRYGTNHGFAVGIGAAIMDVIYCAGATQINEYLLNSPIINLIFQIVGFGLLVFLGIRTLRLAKYPKEHQAADTKSDDKAEAQVERMHIKRGSIIASLALGIVLYASNIASLPEWIFITAFWKSQGLLDEGFRAAVSFAIGAGLGTAGWFLTLTKFFGKRQRSLEPRILRRIDIVAGTAMLVFGVYFGYQILFNTDWSRINKRMDDTFSRHTSITSSI